MMHDGHRKRLRENFLKGGLEPFSDYNVLELILFYAIPRKNTNDTAHNLLETFGSLSGVLDASIDDLKQVDGIGENGALLIKLFLAVSKRYFLDKQGKPELEEVKAIGEYCVSLFTGETVEKAYLLCFDSKNRLQNSVLIAEGSLVTVKIDKRKIMEAIVRNNTVKLILTHNHPNGLAVPSSADVRATREIADLMREISANLMDHVIVADKEYFSMSNHVRFVDLF